MALVELLGETVVRKDKTAVPVSSLQGEGKVLALYFSAHWCPPCRGFTPLLAKWYKSFRDTANGPKLEVVFVSSDKSESDFQEYFGEMPWLALDFSKRDLKGTLSRKFKVSGIPTLIFLDANTGKVNQSDGRSVVNDDPTGDDFPWVAKSFQEIFPGPLINNNKEERSTEDLKGKVIGLYFSAHWCGPCRGFTPSLVKSYNKMREDGKSLEIVFCSSDRDEDSFSEYFKTMPWLALPYGDKRKTALSKAFDVQGIPTLVFLDEDWKLITANGRGAIQRDPEGKDFPFQPKPVNELSGDTASTINDSPTLIWFAANSADAAAKKGMLYPIAEAVIGKAKAKGDSPPLEFLVACEEDDEDEMMEGLMEFCKFTPSQIPFICIINIPAQGVYKDVNTKEFTADSLKALVDDFIAGKLEMQKLR